MGLLDRLINGSNKSRWLDSIKTGDNSERIQTVIQKFLIPDNIDVDKYLENQKANNAVLKFGSLNAFEMLNQLSSERQAIKCTPSFRHDSVQDSLNRGPGMPDWFHIGYPDVAVWIHVNTRRLEMEFEDRSNEFFSADGPTDIFYRVIIDKFKSERGKLELSA